MVLCWFILLWESLLAFLWLLVHSLWWGWERLNDEAEYTCCLPFSSAAASSSARMPGSTQLLSPSNCSVVPTWGAHSYSLPPFLSGRHSWEALICNLTSVHHQPAMWSVYRPSALSAVSPVDLVHLFKPIKPPLSHSFSWVSGTGFFVCSLNFFFLLFISRWFLIVSIS